MSVYVDDMEATYGRMKMCHMLADSTEELLAMADAIGVARKWIQNSGTWREHFDIALSKKRSALKKGAIPITWRQAGAMDARRRATGRLGSPGDAEQWLREHLETVHAPQAPR